MNSNSFLPSTKKLIYISITLIIVIFLIFISFTNKENQNSVVTGPHSLHSTSFGNKNENGSTDYSSNNPTLSSESIQGNLNIKNEENDTQAYDSQIADDQIHAIDNNSERFTELNKQMLKATESKARNEEIAILETEIKEDSELLLTLNGDKDRQTLIQSMLEKKYERLDELKKEKR